ncbi:hypothetical protein [Salinicola lusitanus]|uniref:hypothetical protein n=1 Tax=Salinicola lusitanus TaxID=1949085 RepID=UPI0013007ABF|nr:hypothetical protein [Salinicola lusitanus]
MAPSLTTHQSVTHQPSPDWQFFLTQERRHGHSAPATPTQAFSADRARELFNAAGVPVARWAESNGYSRFMGSVAGNKIDLWTRETIGLRKLDGQWLMIHDHVSVPIDLKTGAGVTDYRP